ncbi:MAG: hypothetical protein AAF196_08155 [Planctomycetota bacterium]
MSTPQSTTRGEGPTDEANEDPRIDRRLKSRVRRRVLVDRQLQIGLAARASMFTFCVIALISAALFLPLIRELSDKSQGNVDVDTAVVLLYLHERFWPLAFGAVILSALLSVLTSHRIAGPLVRVKRNLWSIAQGRIPGPLVTRDRDFLKDEVRALNAATNELRENRSSFDSVCDDMRTTLAEAEREISPENVARTRKALQKIEQQLNLLVDRIGEPETETSEEAAQTTELAETVS